LGRKTDKKDVIVTIGGQHFRRKKITNILADRARGTNGGKKAITRSKPKKML